MPETRHRYKPDVTASACHGFSIGETNLGVIRRMHNENLTTETLELLAHHIGFQRISRHSFHAEFERRLRTRQETESLAN